MGTNESEPVLIAWHWYYNVPSLALWSLLLVLTIVPKRNWKPQAWLILLLPLAIAACFGLLQLLFSGASDFEAFGLFVTALAIAWTCVWLVGHWLGSGNLLRSSFVALGVMFGVGLVGYIGYFGFWFSSDVTWAMVGFWAVGSVSLVASMLLTGISCRGKCSPPRLLLWPMLWVPVASVVSIAVLAVIVALTELRDGAEGMQVLVSYVLAAVVMSPFVAGALYLMNLPVLLLCIYTSCYRERFGLAFLQPQSDIPPDAGGGSPFEGRLNAGSPFMDSVLSGTTDGGGDRLN